MFLAHIDIHDGESLTHIEDVFERKRKIKKSNFMQKVMSIVLQSNT